MKYTQGDMKSNRTGIRNIIENFYKKLYSTVNSKPDNVQVFEKLTNFGIGGILDIREEEIKLALFQIKKDLAPEGDGITREMIQLGGAATIKSMEVFLNKCLQRLMIFDNCLNAHIILLYKKGDTQNIEIYRPKSLVPRPYQLLTKIVTNRFTNKFDNYQPPEQAGFRKGHNTIEQIQNIKILIKMQ